MSEKIEVERYDFFQKLMKIIDEAKGEKNKALVGPFGFLKEEYFVHQAIVTCRTMNKGECKEDGENRGILKKTSIAQLKTYLALEVLQIYPMKNRSRVTYKDIEEQLAGKTTKKYVFDYMILDECRDVKTNFELFLENMTKEHKKFLVNIRDMQEWHPYVFMDRLRTVVWDKLGEFFKLCNCQICSECEKKEEAYFKFVQAVALYEIFYRKLISEVQQENNKKVFKILECIDESLQKAFDCAKAFEENKNIEEYVKALLRYKEDMQRYGEDMQNFVDLENSRRPLSISLFLGYEFGVSLDAMFFLLVLLESIIVSRELVSIENLKKESLEFAEKLYNEYGKDLFVSYFYNTKRLRRYKEVNTCLNEYLQVLYAGITCEKEAYIGAISAFMDELCKPRQRQDKELLKKAEWILAYPLYNS